MNIQELKEKSSEKLINEAENLGCLLYTSDAADD